MFDIHKLKGYIKRAFTPITIMLIPHSKSEPINFKVPFIGIFTAIVLCCFGIVYFISVAVNTVEYYKMKNKLNYYSEQFSKVNTTISSLKKAETEFNRLFSLGSKEQVLENINTSDSGSLDIENLKKEITNSIENIGEIREYLHKQRDIYLSTPRGFPIQGDISSPFGMRVHPQSGVESFHTGIDLSVSSGNPVRATADGIVSFSGRNGGSGNLIVLEHGHGYTTLYAHNRLLVVKVGQMVKRGDIISYSGSTGNSTGPHVHYEIWKDGKPINPINYLKGRG